MILERESSKHASLARFFDMMSYKMRMLEEVCWEDVRLRLYNKIKIINMCRIFTEAHIAYIVEYGIIITPYLQFSS